MLIVKKDLQKNNKKQDKRDFDFIVPELREDAQIKALMNPE